MLVYITAVPGSGKSTVQAQLDRVSQLADRFAAEVVEPRSKVTGADVLDPVGCAYPRGWLKGFDLWVTPEREYRLRAKHVGVGGGGG